MTPTGSPDLDTPGFGFGFSPDPGPGPGRGGRRPEPPVITWPRYESRVILEPASNAALFSILAADMRRHGTQFAHKMIWTLFPDLPEAAREGMFLFLVERRKPFTAIVRSDRPPADGLGGLWSITTRPFDPQLAAGQRLRFRLRAAAGHWQPRPGQKRGRRVDVVTAAWDRLPPEEQTDERREEAAEQAALDWLARQGQRTGFHIADGAVQVLDYDLEQLSPDRPRDGRAPGRAPGGAPGSALGGAPGGAQGGALDGAPAGTHPDTPPTRAEQSTRRRPPPIRFGVLTFEGTLTVTDPAPFRTMLATGLGSARAYGNGLMLVAPDR